MSNVTYETVKAACEELIRQGEKVSADKVLIKTGGSKSTVVKYLREWRDKSEEQQSLLAEQLGFSPEFIQAFNRETYRYTTETKKRYKDSLEQAKSAESFAISALQEAEDTIAELELKVASLEKNQRVIEEQANTKNAVLESTIEQLKKQSAEKDEDIKKLSESRDAALKEVAKYEIKLEDNNRLAQLHEQNIEASKKEVSSLQTKLSESLKNETRLQAELNSIKNQLEKDEKNSVKTTTENQKQIDKLETIIKSQESKFEARNFELQDKLEKIAREKAVTEKEKAVLEKEIEWLRSKVETKKDSSKKN